MLSSNNSIKLLRQLSVLEFTKLRPFSSQQLVVEVKRKEPLKISKKPPRPPFMKNVFLGEFDNDMLVYPELDKTTLQDLKQAVKPYKDYIEGNVDSWAISNLQRIPNEVKDNLKSLGLFGQTIPSVYGGLEKTATETALISEILARDLDLALMLYCHNFLGAQALVMFGSEEQKAKFLPQLASGEKVSAFCLSETVSSSDPSNLDTCIRHSLENQDTFILNGEKCWVTNANNANLFIVFAKYETLLHTGLTVPLVRILLVDRDSPGVTVSKSVEHIGLNASQICTVRFKDTPVSSDCIIEGDTQGFDMCAKILNSGRYNIGAITLSILKTLLNKASDFLISRKQFNKQLSECEIIHNKLSDLARCIYTLESMTYHTTGILDNFENPDCALELALIKVFSFTEGRRCLDLIMELMGGRAFLNSEITQKYFRDFRTMEVFDGTTDIANLFISLIGVQHAGMSMNTNISKLRFPYQYPEFIFKMMLKSRRQINDNPKLILNLFEQLHPSLKESANELEYCVLRMHYAVSMFLRYHGSAAIDHQLELMRLSDAAVKIYAMTCVLARSSRSYCIGLPNAETELKYAMQVCAIYKKRVQDNLNELVDGVYVSGDMSKLKRGSELLQHHGYYLEHPLERSY